MSNELKIQIKRTGNGWLISRNFNEDVDVVKDGESHAHLMQTVSDMLIGDRNTNVCVIDEAEQFTSKSPRKLFIFEGRNPDDENLMVAYPVPANLHFKARNGEVYGPSPDEMAIWLVSIASDLGFDGFKINIGNNEVVFDESKAFFYYDCNNKNCDQGSFKVPHDGDSKTEKCPKCGKKGSPSDNA